MNVWLCRQTRDYGYERADSVVAADTEGVAQNKYRRDTIRRVQPGDIIVHFRGRKRVPGRTLGPSGIVAVSVAQESAREYPPFRSLPKLESNGYGEGLYVRTHYHDLEPVIDESEVIDHFRQLEVAHEFLDANGNFKMAGYLFPFDSAGLNVVRDAYRGRWPLGGQTKRETAQEDQADTDEFKGFIEGGKRSSVQSVRNDGLRESALRKYGYKCYCCGFDFREFYGEVARGRAIVHHLETFSGLDQGGRVATVDDVRVVCANCHYVIHFSKQPRDVDDLKRSIAREWTTWGTRGLSRK